MSKHIYTYSDTIQPCPSFFCVQKRVLGRHMEPAEGEDHLVIRDLGGLAMDSPWIHP